MKNSLHPLHPQHLIQPDQENAVSTVRGVRRVRCFSHPPEEADRELPTEGLRLLAGLLVRAYFQDARVTDDALDGESEP